MQIEEKVIGERVRIMSIKVTDYFDNTIMPMIRDDHSDIYTEMSIMILGSVGLGIDDKFSDMEAAVYLDDPAWHKHGARLQLSLNECLAETNPWQKKGSIICVHPLSWLLDGQANSFFEGKSDLPWEKISIESLFTIQENLIYYDPHATLAHLRKETSPLKYPEHIWRKSLLVKFRQLVSEDYSELKRCVIRNHMVESQILLAPVLEGLLQVAFLLDHQYFPWRTHLRWAFDRLSLPVSNFGTSIDRILSCDSWHEKIDIICNLIDDYKKYIADYALSSEINIWSDDLDEELLWAERLNAWENPNWRDRIILLSKKASESGYSYSDFWVWSLWDSISE